MLSPQQIQQIAQTNGDTVTNPSAGQTPSNPATSGPAPADVAQDFAQSVGYTPDQGMEDTNGFVGGYAGKVLEAAKSGGNEIIDAAKRGASGEEPIEPGMEVAGGIADVLGAPFAPLFNQNGYTPPKGSLADKLTSDPDFQKFAMSSGGDTAIRLVTDLMNLDKAAGVGLGAESEPTLEEAASGIKSAAQDVKANIPNVSGKINDVRVAAAQGKVPGISGVEKQTATAAQRLSDQAPMGGMGAAIIKKPIDMYDEFAAQEAKHLADIKEDPAISMVGSRIGDAFKQVVKMRQDAGKEMGAQLEKIGSNKVPVTKSISAFQKDLLDNGATYDSTMQSIIPSGSSKFSSADNKILEKYATELQSLGKNPSLKEVDAFLGRMPNEIKALKSTNAINFKTNAERIVANNLKSLRQDLTNGASKEYTAARSKYANLSNFVNEGVPYLGKITQSGDFAKDASIAKSSVQSVLNNGKKDWLLKLEDLTGYPAMDESTLALQAMKDAGDYKGSSLLDLMTENGKSVPTSPSGLAKRIIGFVGKKAANTVLGDSAERTRAFLQSLEK